MARVQFGTIVTNLSGSIGGTTFSRNTSGAIAKAHLVGKRRTTSKQSVSLSNSLFITNAWVALTPAQRSDFNAYASVNTFLDRYGNVKTLSGFQWFKNLAWNQFYLDASLPVAPSPYEIAAALPSFTFSASVGVMLVEWSTPIDVVTTDVMVFATPPIRGLSDKQRSTFRQLDVRSLDKEVSFDIANSWQSVFDIDLLSLSTSSKFQVSVLIYPVNKSSFVSGSSVFANSNYSPVATGIGAMAIGYTFIVS